MIKRVILALALLGGIAGALTVVGVQQAAACDATHTS
jgi:hypothetical protein